MTQTQRFFVSQEPIILQINSLNYIEVTYNSKTKLWLLDTGATLSVIFDSEIPKNQFVDTSNILKVNGISGSTHTQGVAELAINIGERTINHSFHVMQRNIKSAYAGILGAEWFIRFQASINFQNFTFSFCVNDVRTTVPMCSDQDLLTILPPRCEIIKYFTINGTEKEYLVSSEEIANGVFTASAIVKPNKNHQIPVKILNTNDSQVTIKNYVPHTENFDNFDCVQFGDVPFSVKRIDTVLKLLNCDNLNEEEKISLHKICAKFADVFHIAGDVLEISKLPMQEIRIKPGVSPIYTRQYRLPYAQKAEVHKQIDKMLKDGIITDSKSEWSSPLLVVPKKAGLQQTWRVVTDYRAINNVIQDDPFPLPLVEEVLDSLNGALYYSHLDLTQAYYQVGLEEKSRKYTAFSTDRGRYELTRIPMGMKTSANCFSRAMTLAMTGLTHESCLIYLDDLCVFGSTLENHNQNLIKVLQRLRDLNLKLNPSKCKFLQKDILYLGHVVSANGIQPDPEKIKVIQNYPMPTTVKETKRFVAFANFYRKYIKGFADIAKPLNALTKKGVKFIWSEECQNSFETLKTALTNPPVLAFPNFDKNNQFVLKTDASNMALGAILCNSDDRPVAYASRQLSKAEISYPVIQKELLSICFAVKKFRPYLWGRKFKILTDHRPLVYLFGMKDPSSRLTKFRLELEQYDFIIEYIKGIHNLGPDALLRIRITSDELKDLTQATNDTIMAITRAQAKNQLKESEDSSDDGSSDIEDRVDHPGFLELLKSPKEATEFIGLDSEGEFEKIKNCEHEYFKLGNLIYDVNKNIIYIVKEPSRSTYVLNTSLRDLVMMCKKYNISELILKKERARKNEKFIREISKCSQKLRKTGIKFSVIHSAQCISDTEVQQLIINDFHILPSAGHAGINRVYKNIRKHYFWKGMRGQIEKFISKCDTCQRYKHSVIKKQPLEITTTATTALSKVFLDLVGPLQQDGDGYKYILTLQCELSKFVEAYPLKDKESRSVAQAFVNNFILRYGVPREVVTDRGSEFVSSLFSESCKILGIKKLTSTAYHHETLGALENSHKNLGAFLRMQIAKFSENWSDWVSFWTFAYNTTIHTQTKYSPYELVFGKSCILPSNIERGEIEPLYVFSDYPLELKFRLQRACLDARENLIQSKLNRKEKFDVKTKSVTYKIGSNVLIRNESGKKMDQIYDGPFTVVKDCDKNVLVKIKGKDTLVHKNRVKLYRS